MSYQRRITYRTGLFDPVNLNSFDKIDDSLSQFEAILNEDNYAQALDDLLDDIHTVELILSGLSSLANCSYTDFEFVGMSDTLLNTWILKHFPTTFDSFVSSFENKLLCKLSMFHYFHTSPDAVDYNVLRDHHRTVTLAPEALQALFAIAFLKEEEHPPDSSFKKGKAKSQKKLKAKHALAHECDTKPLNGLNIAIPHTCSDAQTALTALLDRLKDILEVCAL
jgi:hypothetical protein